VIGGGTMEDNEEVLRDGPPPLDCREICRIIGIDLRLKGYLYFPHQGSCSVMCKQLTINLGDRMREHCTCTSMESGYSVATAGFN